MICFTRWTNNFFVKVVFVLMHQSKLYEIHGWMGADLLFIDLILRFSISLDVVPMSKQLASSALVILWNSESLKDNFLLSISVFFSEIKFGAWFIWLNSNISLHVHSCTDGKVVIISFSKTIEDSTRDKSLQKKKSIRVEDWDMMRVVTKYMEGNQKMQAN